MEFWDNQEILKISKVRYQELIDERDQKIQEQREYYYLNAPEQVIIQNDDEVTVEYGRVKNVLDKTYNDFVREGVMDWKSYYEYGMASKKKCQIITLENDKREFRVVFGISAIGVKKWDVIKFKGEADEAVVIIPSISGIGGIGTFSIAIPITVYDTFYPSITAAYEIIRPEFTYGYITQLIRDGMEPNQAFSKKKKLGSDQIHGSIVKMLSK
ncbi:MAG: hypothetical protein COA36_13295 [Desulfotalea sp.]|nr:MAG: hypothetical protein COA36_13295 [Desulfotalea sp.]